MAMAIMARGTLRLSLDMAMAPATPTDLPRVFLDTMAAMDMEVMDMAATTERETLRLSLDMDTPEATPTDLPRDSLDTMAVMVMLDMAMVLLPTIPMAVPALSTEAPRV